MRLFIFALFALLAIGCTQAPAPASTTPNATDALTTAPTLSTHLANAENLFTKPGLARYSVAITFPTNLTEEQRPIAEFMKGLLQGQESTAAWNTSIFRLDTHVGLLGESLNHTTYLAINASLWCVDGKCETADLKDTEERLDIARKALQSPYNFLPMPKSVDPTLAWIATPTGDAQKAGRTCDGYDLLLNHTYLNRTLYSIPAGDLEDLKEVKQAVIFKGITTPLKTCLDRERGYVAYARLEIDLSKARNDDKLRGLRMIMTQEIQKFQDVPGAADLQKPAELETAPKTSVPEGVSILPLGAAATGSDGTRYEYLGKKNGSFILNASNVKNASCGTKQLALPEWTVFECNGTANLFLIYEEKSDEFQLAVRQSAFEIQTYDPSKNIVYVLPEGMPVPFSHLPLIMQYDGKLGNDDVVYIGPWQGPCPTERIVLDDTPARYSCDGTNYVIRKDSVQDRKNALGVQVLKTE
ncbi:hypothetical protein HY994_02075 [Candidatus Micrarchaeota archaeon]|nr:hypothetical protein [Candidatus Micrarchaeota archaeon]